MNNTSQISRWLYLLVAIASSLCLVVYGQQPPSTNYDESKVGTYTLPDPLVFNDGRPVRNAVDWTRRRRAELIELFATHVYGHSPASPKKLNYEVFDSDQNALGGKAIRKQITIYFSERKDGPKEDLLLYIPKDAPKPVSAFLILSFSGNQSAASDPAIKLGTAWNPRTRQKQQAPDSSRGRTQADTEAILARGYAFATINYVDIEPDFKGRYFSNPARPNPLQVSGAQLVPGHMDSAGRLTTWTRTTTSTRNELPSSDTHDWARQYFGPARLIHVSPWWLPVAQAKAALPFRDGITENAFGI